VVAGAGSVRVGAADFGFPDGSLAEPGGLGAAGEEGGCVGAGRDGADGTPPDPPARRSSSTEISTSSPGVAVRSTGSIATEASTMLVRVAASQPSSGNQLRGDRTRQ
jgi:hypothetical protein